MAPPGPDGPRGGGALIRARAHAKVNLCLEVLGPRADGYHEVATVLQALSLADELSVEPAGTLALNCDDPSLTGRDNLALRAAEALQQEAGVRWGARISLAKRIPVAAGLGGGSADAAAALLALDRLWETRLSPEDLARLGAALGSDVPFFLQGSATALAEGRGERVTPLVAPLPVWALVLLPAVPAPERKTATLYGMLRAEDYTDGCRARRWATRLTEGAPWRGLWQNPGLANAFEAVAGTAFPGIQGDWEAFRRAVEPAPVHLAGSGPALFALFDDGPRAARARAALEGQGHRAILVETASCPPVEIALEG